ncbi:MAG: hypothetical protein OEL69_09565 [Nitrosopumilus sp.]|nr:hypothetical protein [Nitrosopumilus sp.]
MQRNVMQFMGFLKSLSKFCVLKKVRDKANLPKDAEERTKN